MITNRLFALLCSLSLVFVYIACQRDNFDALPSTPPLPEKVQITVNGRILDDQQVPVTGAVVKAGTLTANTDLNGYFEIRDVTLDANAGFLKVEKAGFFSGSRTFKAIKGSSHYVTVQLIKKNDAGSFSGTAGGNITVPNGGSISFEADAVIDPQTKTPYTGTVSVSAFWLNPTVANFLEIMPGELRGIDENDKQVGLQSFGMMVVELTGAAGEKLQLNGSKPATMKFPIAPAQQASAPASIAFWSFNDSTGLWKQEGMAARQGNEYIGKASHFSFWNVDAPFALVDFKATLKDQNGNPLRNTKVVIQTAGNPYGPMAYSFSDTAGVIAGLIPAGAKLELGVFGPCNTVMDSREIGPFNANTDMGVVTVTIAVNEMIHFKGEVLNCDGQSLANGFADLSFLGQYRRANIVNGVLNYNFIRCGNQDAKATVRITDLTDNVIGPLIELNVSGNTADIGQVKVCDGGVIEYLSYTIGTETRQFLPPADSVKIYGYNEYHFIAYTTKDTSNVVHIQFMQDPGGTVFTSDNLEITVNKVVYTKAAPYTLQITEFGANGEFIAGTFSGSMKKKYESDPTELPINGRFRLKRTY